MKKLFTCLAMFFVVIGCSLFAGCSLTEFEFDINAGYDEPLEEYVDPDYKFNVSCSLDKTTITLDGIGYYGDEAKVVSLKPYEYLYGENQTGICENTNATPNVIADYECGKGAQVEINRFDADGYDTVYCKFYVIDDGGEILAGPVYPTEITPENDHEEVVKVVGKKGIMCDDMYRSEVADLNCVYTELNFVISGMIVPLENYDEITQQITPIKYEEHLDENGKGYIVGPDGVQQEVEAYVHNGKKYYFRVCDYAGINGLRHYDEIISHYTRDGVKVTLIVLLIFNDNQLVQPYFMTYPDARTSKSKLLAINTSNEYGAGYWAALMEFVAKRYSKEDDASTAQYGAVETFVIENEIDAANDWHAMVDDKHEPIDLEDYTVEYERTLRIANQSMKSAFSRDVALISFTNYWKYDKGWAATYQSKDILDIISSKTRREGNYNWGIAAHPYGFNLRIPNFWSNDINYVNGSLNTAAITWTNLEVLQLYLEQETKLCNGKVRDVYITEGGISACPKGEQLTDAAKRQQAAGVAYAYYKSTQLSCIKALIYYRLIDNTDDGGHFGLLSTDEQIKPAYEVYRFIDTQYSFEITNQYYDCIKWVKMENGTLHTYPETFGEPSYQNLMCICPSKFDWTTHWDESLIIVRETSETPPLTQV